MRWPSLSLSLSLSHLNFLHFWWIWSCMGLFWTLEWVWGSLAVCLHSRDCLGLVSGQQQSWSERHCMICDLVYQVLWSDYFCLHLSNLWAGKPTSKPSDMHADFLEDFWVNCLSAPGIKKCCEKLHTVWNHALKSVDQVFKWKKRLSPSKKKNSHIVHIVLH